MTPEQLKASILQYAIQGNLVEQRPEEGTGEELYRQIQAEKQRLIKEKKIKKEKNPSVIFRSTDNSPYTFLEKIGDEIRDISDEIPFDIPESWEWVRLGYISTYAYVKTKINAKCVPAETWVLDLEDIEKGGRLLQKKSVGERKAVGDKTVFNKGDILYSKLRPYLLKILVAPDTGICTPEIVPFSMFDKIYAEYIVAYLSSPYVDNLINAITYGIKMPRVGTETMVNLLVPLPPLAEQHRIVAKIGELLPHIENYTEVETKLNALNATFPTQLKKSILQQAVQGKLVPQNPDDEPASVLLERIRAEKQELIKAGKIKKDKNESVIFRRDNSHYEMVNGIERCIDDEIPFEVPENWCWCRLSAIVSILGDGIHGTPSYTPNGEVAFINGNNLFNGKIIIKDDTKTVSIAESYKHTRELCKSTVLVSINGTIGNIAFYNNEKVILGKSACYFNLLSGIQKEYIIMIYIN